MSEAFLGAYPTQNLGDSSEHDRFLFFQEALDLFTHQNAGHLIHRCYTKEGLIHWAEFMRSPYYYITNSELFLIKTCSEKIFEVVSRHSDERIIAIELGPGSEIAIAKKTIPFLSSFKRLGAYCPIDWSFDSLDMASKIVKDAFPCVTVVPSFADFNTVPVPILPAGRKVMFEFGVTFSNIPGQFYDPLPYSTVHSFLSFYRSQLSEGDFFVVTYDSNQDEESLVKAYSDENCALWARALFQRMKNELPISQDFNPEDFYFKSIWNPDNHLLSHNLIACHSGQFQIGRNVIEYSKGEKFGITNSYKYPIELFINFSESCGFQSEIFFEDPDTKMVLHVLKAA